MAFIPASPPALRSACVFTPRQPARPDLARAMHARRTRAPPRMDLAGAGIYHADTTPSDVHVVIFGATGYIGRYVVFEFLKQGYQVTAFARDKSGVSARKTRDDVQQDLRGARVVFGDVTNAADVARAFEPHADSASARSTIVVSCLASRTGGIEDSNRIDYAATLNTLQTGRRAGANHFILLSAICVQKPLLEFQRAKLKFEAELAQLAQQDDSFSYSIVRPTAFFKSLAGQIERLKKGSAFIMFGDGDLCKCNALSEADLARFIALCATDVEKRNQILPVGGPGAPVTPKQQAEMQFRLVGKEPKYISLPIGLMDGAIGLLDALATFLPFMRDPAEFGKIGKYYAVEDMVAPPFGQDTLEDFFQSAIQDGGLDGQELGDAAIF